MTDLRMEEDAGGDALTIEAARWFARRRSGEMTFVEEAELETWLESEAAHRMAYDSVARAWAGTGLMRTEPGVLTLRARYRRPFPRLRRWAASRPIAAAVAAGVVGLGAFGAVETRLIDLERLPTETYATQVGEQRTIKLPDGSSVTLNTDTVLHTHGARTERRLYLERGQAFFRVAKDPSRPFVVHAGGRMVTAIGTAFDVRVDGGRFEVVLVEGKVKVETPLAPVTRTAALGDSRDPPPPPLKVQASELVAGSEFVADGDRGWRVDKTDVATETSWVTGWLQFDREPLGSIVEELSRYSQRRIVLQDPELAGVPVSGRFRPGDTDAFVRALDTYGIARVARSSAVEIRLSSVPKKSASESMGG